MTEADRPSLVALFFRFLRFGALAWGGPVAQIAMIKRDLVDEARWLSPGRFTRLLAVYQILPGPEAHELCVHLGMMKRGRAGGLLAGLGFMLPGLILVLAISWLYQRLDLTNPTTAAALLGAQLGVIALIVRAVHRIGQHALTDYWLWVIGLTTAIASLLGVTFWVLLVGAGLAHAMARAANPWLAMTLLLATCAIALTLPSLPEATVKDSASGPVSTATAAALFWSGLKAGLLTFGGAYTAIPFVRDDTVARGWVSEGQFLDSLALTGIIPAPLIIFATFVGYQAAGFGGALAMTAGIFLPAFGFSLLFYDRLERLLENERLQGFLEGVTAGVVGLIAATTLHLAGGLAATVPAPLPATAIFAASIAVLYLSRSRLAVPAVVLASAATGIAAFT